ncbi:MAG: hypothetical protein ABJ056_04320 [Halioglobus sp.]
MTAPILISLHMPKTAGSSFGLALKNEYGQGFVEDYGDRPLQAHATARIGRAMALAGANMIGLSASESTVCIHGHFLPVKYRFVRRPALFITWLREPVERLGSHYHYWRRSYDPQSALPLHAKVVEENWSFEQFYRAPELRNLYGKFLWGFPAARFSFIGISEHYEQELERFALTVRTFSSGMKAERVNENPGQPAVYVQDEQQRREIEQIHADDVLLYQRACRARLAALARLEVTNE